MEKPMKKPMKFVAVQKWDDGGEAVIEYFKTMEETLKWIRKQGKEEGFKWYVGEF